MNRFAKNVIFFGEVSRWKVKGGRWKVEAGSWKLDSDSDGDSDRKSTDSVFDNIRVIFRETQYVG